MRISIVILLGAVLVVILQIIGYFHAGASLWGVNHYALLPTAWLGLGGLLALGVFLWTLFGRSPRFPIPTMLIYFLVLGAGITLFWFGRQTTHFLGDGAFWIEGVRRARLLWLNEPGALFGVFYLNRLTGSPDPATTFAVVSVAAGAVYLGLSLYLARLVFTAPGDRAIFFCVLTFAGLTRLFYGYVETYPILAAVIMVYLVLGLRYVRGTGSPLLLTLTATLAVGIHFTAALALPSLIYLLWMGNDTPSSRRRRLSTLLIPLAAAGIGFLVIGSKVDPISIYSGYIDKLLPLFGEGSTRFAYSLLSLRHLLDFFQEQLLLGPFAALVGILILAGQRSRLTADERFLLWVGIPWWGLSFLYNREIGAARDWDLFSVASIPFLILMGLLLPRHLAAFPGSRLARCSVGLLLGASLFHTVPWIALGQNAGQSLVHFASLFGKGSNTSPFARSYAWEQIGMYYMEHQRIPDAREAWATAVDADTSNGRVAGLYAGLLIETGEAEEAFQVLETALRRTPYRAFLHFQLATLYHQRGENEQARMEFEYALERNPKLEDAYVGLSVVERSTNRLPDAEATLRRGLEYFPESPPLLAQLGIVLQTRGDTTGALDAYRRTLATNRGDMTSTYNLALLLLSSGHPEEARPHFEAVVAHQPNDVEAWINLGVSLDALGQSRAALTAFTKARTVNPFRAEPYFNSVRIHLNHNETALAREMLQDYLQRDATSQYGRLAEKLLKELPAP